MKNSSFKIQFKYKVLQILKHLKAVKYYPSQKLSLKEINIEPTSDIKEIYDDDYSIYQLKNARVWGSNGTVISESNNYYSELNRYLSSLDKDPIFYQHHFKRPNELKNVTVAIVASVAGNVYYHWMIDVLPRIILLKKANLFDSIDYFFFNTIKYPFQIETLSLLGIDKQKIISLDNLWDSHYLVENLYFPSFTSKLNESSQYSIDAIKSCFNIPPVLVKRRLFLSRKKAKNRKLLQEKEILSYLEAYKFELFYPEDHTVSEQAVAFNQAEIIVGPHGSGFTNIVFCKPDTKVVDICAPEWINDCFLKISELNNLDYTRIIGEKHKSYNYNENKGADIQLDFNLFKSTINKIIS